MSPQTLTAPVKVISNKLNLLVEVWDKDHVGTDDFLGQYALSFTHDAIELDGSDVNVALAPRKMKEKVKGTLTFSISYKRTFASF